MKYHTILNLTSQLPPFLRCDCDVGTPQGRPGELRNHLVDAQFAPSPSMFHTNTMLKPWGLRQNPDLPRTTGSWGVVDGNVGRVLDRGSGGLLVLLSRLGSSLDRDLDGFEVRIDRQTK